MRDLVRHPIHPQWESRRTSVFDGHHLRDLNRHRNWVQSPGGLSVSLKWAKLSYGDDERKENTRKEILIKSEFSFINNLLMFIQSWYFCSCMVVDKNRFRKQKSMTATFAGFRKNFNKNDEWKHRVAMDWLWKRVKGLFRVARVWKWGG